MKRWVFVFWILLTVNGLGTEDWTLTGGVGQRLPGGVLEVSGTGSDSNAWVGPVIPIEPGGLYRFSMEACSPTGGGGCAPCGLEGFHRDRSDITRDWKPFSYVFRAPNDKTEGRLRVGQWESKQTYRFRNMTLTPVEAIPRGLRLPGRKDHYLLLGDGEIIRNGVYRFNSSLSGPGANVQCPFVRTTTGFNTDRFTFGSEEEVVYTFRQNIIGSGSGFLDGLHWVAFFQRGTVEVHVNHHVRGSCVVETSAEKDGPWKEIGRLDKTGTIKAEVSSSFFGEPIFLRIRSGEDASFQVNRVAFEAACSNPDAVGETVYADVEGSDEPVPEGYSSAPMFFDEQRTLYVCHVNDSGESVKPIVTNPPSRVPGRYQSRFYTFTEPFDPMKAEIPARSVCFETKPLAKAPEFVVPFTGRKLRYSFPYHFYRDGDFGYGLKSAATGKTLSGIWWAEPDWKVSPDVPALQRTSQYVEPVFLTAARNDFESFQLVVGGGESGRQEVTLTVDGDLRGEDGAAIPAENVRLRYAYYHFIERPTDALGRTGEWPDALPPLAVPLAPPLEIKPKRNQPLWVTVYVPENTPAGFYESRLTLRWRENGEAFEEAIPFTLRVWNFTLPKRNTLQTAFGRNAHLAFDYHNCQTEEDRRALLELYHKNFAEHRVSVYDPVPLDPIRITWRPDAEPPCAELDFTAFDREMERVIEAYNISGFMVRLQGMRWGTFEERGPGKIQDFEEGTPQYEAMMADYLGKLQSHLEEKGWIDMAYTYWFDEPDPKDYDFVAEGFARLQKHAPKLRRMITEEPNAGFLAALEKAGATINVWCPVSYNFSDDEARQRQKAGENLWWYVCCGPKEPYCTLFIDHPSHELRLWHWQAWQRGIVGTLIWDSNYWTSPAAFPDSRQNPYEDPMSYVYGGEPGTKNDWGNGDGRFVYPPLDAAVPGGNDGKPILKEPVSSIRWEMIREGIEDYEMLVLLRSLKEKHPDAAERIDTLLLVPAEISSSLTEFAPDARPIYQRRRLVGDLIEKLGN